MKCNMSVTYIWGPTVAPLAGAWIEMAMMRFKMNLIQVAPLAGAWIEIIQYVGIADQEDAQPKRERGWKGV